MNPMKSEILQLTYDLIKASGKDGISIDELAGMLSDHLTGSFPHNQVGARCGTLSHLGLAEKRDGRWYIADESLDPVPPPRSNGHNGHTPTPDAPVMVNASRTGEQVAVPPIRQGWSGVVVAVQADPHIYGNVIRAEFTRDGVHFDPILLTGDLRFHIGVQTPVWGWEQISYAHVQALRVEYLDGDKARRDCIDINGRNLTIARRIDEGI